MKTLGKWLIAIIYCVWCVVVAGVLIGETDPNVQLTLVDFVVIKLLAFAAIYTTYCVGRFCYHNQLFPQAICGTKGGAA